MFYYFLPQPTIHGGIKVGFQFAAIMQKLGFDVVMVTPNGSAPNWFPSNLPVLRRERVLPLLRKTDKVIFSLPHDYDELARSGAKLILHCQGTDDLIVPILQDKKVDVLTCWDQATNFVEEHSRLSENVGISISESFFYAGQPKKPQSYAHMPRRGVLFNQDKLERFVGIAIDNLTELKTSETLKTVSGFIATSENEWFGLPALEAMAAGCLVVSPKTIGGGEYLADGQNCLIADKKDLADTMFEALSGEKIYAHLRVAALNTALSYHPRTQLKHLQQKIASGGLKCLL